MEEMRRARYGMGGGVQSLPAISRHTTLPDLLHVHQIGNSETRCSGAFMEVEFHIHD